MAMDLEGLLDDAQFDRIASYMSIKAAITKGAARGGDAVRLVHRASFAIADYTPGGATLSNANVAQAIRNAYAAAVAAGGGEVLIPGGLWNMGAAGALVFDGVGHVTPGCSVFIRGAGSACTYLMFPTPWTDAAIHFRGSPPAAPYIGGGLSGLSIYCTTADAANTGIGIKIDACVYTTFDDVDVRNFQGGTGWECRDYAGGSYNSQYVQFYCVRSGINARNYDFSDLTNCQAVGMFAGFATDTEFTFGRGVMLAVYGGHVQSDAENFFQFDDDPVDSGGNRVSLQDMYYEGSNPDTVVLRAGVPGAVGYNSVEIRRFHLGGTIDLFADVDAYTNVLIDTVYRAGNATKILKARNANSGLTLINCGTPLSAPAFFDLDTVSARNLVALSNGDSYHGALQVYGGLELGAYAEGLEPLSLPDRTLLFNTTSQRPRVRGSAAWHDVGYVDDPISLTDVLAPYCEAIFDPLVASSRTLVSSDLDVLTDVLNGGTLTAAGPTQRPVFTASDPLLGNQPSFACAYTGNKHMVLALDTPIPIGAYPGVFVVLRQIGVQPSARRYVVQLELSTVIGCDDGNVANNFYGAYDTSAPSFALLDSGIAAAGDHGHLVYLRISGNDGGKLFVRVDQNPETGHNALQGGLTTAIAAGYVGYDPLEPASANVAIAYLAVLKEPLPASAFSKASSLARARFAL